MKRKSAYNLAHTKYMRHNNISNENITFIHAWEVCVMCMCVYRVAAYKSENEKSHFDPGKTESNRLINH